MLSQRRSSSRQSRPTPRPSSDGQSSTRVQRAISLPPTHRQQTSAKPLYLLLPAYPMERECNRRTLALSICQNYQPPPEMPTSYLASHHTLFYPLLQCAMPAVPSPSPRLDALSCIVGALSSVATNAHVLASGWSHSSKKGIQIQAQHQPRTPQPQLQWLPTSRPRHLPQSTPATSINSSAPQRNLP